MAVRADARASMFRGSLGSNWRNGFLEQLANALGGAISTPLRANDDFNVWQVVLEAEFHKRYEIWKSYGLGFFGCPSAVAAEEAAGFDMTQECAI